MKRMPVEDCFHWTDRGGVNDGDDRRLAIIHCNAPEGFWAVAVYRSDAEERSPGPDRLIETRPYYRSRKEAREKITRCLIGLGMLETPVRFPRSPLETWLTITEQMEQLS